MDRPLRIGTRASPLALAQAHLVAAALCAAHKWEKDRVEIVPITTTGDVIQDRPLAEVGGKQLWTKELDRCLLDGRTDLSVHSMKDVETLRPDALVITAMMQRADPRDRLIGPRQLEDIAAGALLGTSSPRRTAQVRARRPDLQVVPIRGNVGTRLARLERGEVAATLLAAAGLDRLGMHDVGTVMDDMLPAPSQGAVGIETRTADLDVRALIEPVDHRETHLAVDAERAFLAAIGGDCRSAVAAHARCEGGEMHLRAEILLPDGSEVVAGETRFPAGEAAEPAILARDVLGRASLPLREMFAA